MNGGYCLKNMKVDLHVHTNYSSCSNLELNRLKKLCENFKIFPAITDHGTIEGAKEFKNCIIGEEIKTKEGEIIGLFLNETIPEGLEIEETIDKIKKQGGLIYVPHPFDWLRMNVKRLNFKIDIIEVFNGRVIQQKINRKAMEFAERNSILKGVGSDTHTEIEFGNIYNEIEEFREPKEFLKKLKNANLIMNPHPAYVHILGKSRSIIQKYI